MHEAGSSSEFGAGAGGHVDAHSGTGSAADRSSACSDAGSAADRRACCDAGSAAGCGATPGAPSGEIPAATAADARTHRGAGLVPVPTAPGPVVPTQRGVRDAARGEVLLRHARLASSGRPVFCTPSRAELAGVVSPRAGRGTDGKVIYPTREAAEAAARELEALGARSLRAYRCSRSRRGHFHLTTDSTPRAHLPVHLRIPQQRLSA
jgi:hypothetical protein